MILKQQGDDSSLKTSRLKPRPQVSSVALLTAGSEEQSPPSDSVYRTGSSQEQEHCPRTPRKKGASALRGPSGVAAPDATRLAAYGRAGIAPGLFQSAATASRGLDGADEAAEAKGTAEPAPPRRPGRQRSPASIPPRG